MPNETQQPLGEQPNRRKDDSELVGQVLGEQAAEEMEELTEKKDANTTNSVTTPKLGMSAGETNAAQAAEQIVTPEHRRQQYYQWAEEISKNTDWIDETFIFESDGRVRVEGDLNLYNTGISELPPGLYKVEGRLFLIKNNITTIKNIPESVTELYLDHNKITKIENIPDSVIELNLNQNQITTIENIPKSVTRLILSNNQITKEENIPDSVTSCFLEGNPIES